MRVDNFDFEETNYGFRWGPAEIERTASAKSWGVVFTIKTARGDFVVRVTPTGYFRLKPVVPKLHGAKRSGAERK